MLTYAGLFSENRSVTDPFKRLTYAKKFFTPFRLLKYGEYCGVDISELTKVQKAVEKSFCIPDLIVAGTDFLNPETSYWKRANSCVKIINSGTSSLLWLNDLALEKSAPFLSEGSSAVLEKISTFGKLVDSKSRAIPVEKRKISHADSPLAVAHGGFYFWFICAVFSYFVRLKRS